MKWKRWLDYWWYSYLWTSKNWTILWCRARGHPGVVWFNPGGLEPDMHCTRCGENLG